MNTSIAHDVYDSLYSSELSEEKFMTLLERGLQLLTQNSNTDKLFVHRFYKGDDIKAVNIALTYNQEVMVRLLMD